MKEQQVILVNEKDEEVGLMEKMEAHREGLLHRAFSIFIFDKAGRMLLQQRAADKYHGGLLWTNACCSHPRSGEMVEQAAARRLKEELGFYTPLEKIYSFCYKASVENNLIEHEYDHVFVGEYDGEIFPNPMEVKACRYESMQNIQAAILAHPAAYTEWFKLAFPELMNWWERIYVAA